MKLNTVMTGLIVSTFLTACVSTAQTDVPEGYTFAVMAKEILNITEPVNVAYGANGKYFYKYNQKKSIKCNNSVFGDPIRGTKKKCYIQKVN